MHKTRKDPFVKQKKINRLTGEKQEKFIKENGSEKIIANAIRVGEKKVRKTPLLKYSRISKQDTPIKNIGAIVIEEVKARKK